MSPPMFSSLYLVCESHRHATALAIVLFFANLIGLGLGPFLAGVISDYLAPSYGPAESLRWAIMILFLSMFAAGGFMLRAARHIETAIRDGRSEEHTSELQSLMRNSYAVFCFKKQKTTNSQQ